MASQQHTASAQTAQLSLLSSKEIWKPIPGFDGLYEASTLGNIRRVTWSYVSNKGMTVSVKGHILRPGKGTKTRPKACYRYATLSVQGQTYRRPIHRLVLETFVGPRPEGYVCNHIDGNPTNNTLENLEWVTWQRNAEDCVERGTKIVRRGEASHWARFSVPQIIAIRELATTGMSYGQIAKYFDTYTSTISKIVHRITWTHIK